MKEEKNKHRIRLKRRNWIFIILGFLFIGIGYLFLTKGSLTLAPILLVMGYCVLIPLGIILK